jgi:deoxyribodipyrimidine photo-lyase
MANAIVWFRRDLRLADNPALQAALDAGHAPIPVYIHAPEEERPWQPGAASQAWLHHSLAALSADLSRLGSRLLIRRGRSLECLQRLIEEFEVEAVYWNRLYEPAAIARDTRVKQALAAQGLQVESFNAALLVEPWTVATLGGDPYRVFTPFWRNASQRVAGQEPIAPPRSLPAVPAPPQDQQLQSLRLLPRMGWDAGFWQGWQPGEAGAAELLEAFVDGAAHGYKEQRNFPDRTGTSKLSPHLHFGEISPRQVAAQIRREHNPPIAETDRAHLLSELGWREFSHHLLFHFPHTPDSNLTEKFARFRWAEADPALLERWQRGNTGVPLVDAGMRELWHTGWMHNRVRMVVASFLTKNLRYHWSHGARWFWDTLVDADLANNTQGWQWSAGTGADAAPYFRIFSPVAQAERFDLQGKYIRKWVPELAQLPAPALFAPWEHAALARRLAPDYPATPIIDLRQSREAALLAYQQAK